MTRESRIVIFGAKVRRMCNNDKIQYMHYNRFAHW